MLGFDTVDHYWDLPIMFLVVQLIVDGKINVSFESNNAELNLVDAEVKICAN
jgi:hypothetical protein